MCRRHIWPAHPAADASAHPALRATVGATPRLRALVGGPLFANPGVDRTR